MPEVRADALTAGDVVRVNGQQATLERVKVKGKRVRLVLATRRGAFDVEVKASTKYDRVVLTTDTVQRAAKSLQATGPLHDRRGAQMRWANEADVDPFVEPPRPDATESWSDAERSEVEEFGAKLLGVEVAGGKLIVPPVNDATVFGHLLTMHGVRFDGATFADAKAHARAHPEETGTLDGVLDVLTMRNAHALHVELHEKADLVSWPQPHWHRDEAPR